MFRQLFPEYSTRYRSPRCVDRVEQLSKHGWRRLWCNFDIIRRLNAFIDCYMRIYNGEFLNFYFVSDCEWFCFYSSHKIATLRFYERKQRFILSVKYRFHQNPRYIYNFILMKFIISLVWVRVSYLSQSHTHSLKSERIKLAKFFRLFLSNVKK